MTHQEWRQSPKGQALWQRYTEGPDKDRDLAYGFDGIDRWGRIFYGRGMRLEVGPSPATGFFFTTDTQS